MLTERETHGQKGVIGYAWPFHRRFGPAAGALRLDHLLQSPFVAFPEWYGLARRSARSSVLTAAQLPYEFEWSRFAEARWPTHFPLRSLLTLLALSTHDWLLTFTYDGHLTPGIPGQKFSCLLPPTQLIGARFHLYGSGLAPILRVYSSAWCLLCQFAWRRSLALLLVCIQHEVPRFLTALDGF
jgi:hypothetical protein